jgi:hypothetical protein
MISRPEEINTYDQPKLRRSCTSRHKQFVDGRQKANSHSSELPVGIVDFLAARFSFCGSGCTQKRFRPDPKRGAETVFAPRRSHSATPSPEHVFGSVTRSMESP